MSGREGAPVEGERGGNRSIALISVLISGLANEKNSVNNTVALMSQDVASGRLLLIYSLIDTQRQRLASC